MLGTPCEYNNGTGGAAEESQEWTDEVWKQSINGTIVVM